MPDPLTHLCSALLPKAVTGGPHSGAFAVGAVLPDFSSLIPGVSLDRLAMHGVPVPALLIRMWGVFHTPLGAAVLVVNLALWFREDQRGGVLRWLLLGVASHFLLDALQFHYDGGYLLLFPVSLHRFQIGCMGSEATVPWAPWISLVTALAWGARLAWQRRRTS